MKLIIMGFDGTLANTLPGILYCLNTTVRAMGFSPVDKDALNDVIGKPLEYGFKKLFDMTDEEIAYACSNYSKLYSQKGIEMITMYENMENVLKSLKEQGFMLAIATQKNAMFATNILKTYGLDYLFDVVSASHVGTNLSKSGLIQKVFEQLNVSKSDCVYIGDTTDDAESAKELGIDFIGALFGYGFATLEDVKKTGFDKCAVTPTDLLDIIKSYNN